MKGSMPPVRAQTYRVTLVLLSISGLSHHAARAL